MQLVINSNNECSLHLAVTGVLFIYFFSGPNMCKSWGSPKILFPPPGLARSPPMAVPGLRPGGVHNKFFCYSRLNSQQKLLTSQHFNSMYPIYKHVKHHGNLFLWLKVDEKSFIKRDNPQIFSFCKWCILNF